MSNATRFLLLGLLALPVIASAQPVPLAVQRVWTKDAGGSDNTIFAPGETIQFIAQLNTSYGEYLLAANGTQITVTTSPRFYNDTKPVDIPPDMSTWTWSAIAPSTEASYTVTVQAYDHFYGTWTEGSASFTVGRSTVSEPNEQVGLGMPFTGGYARHRNSHPSNHDIYWGNWSVDLYAPEGTEVRARMLNPTGTLAIRVADVGPTLAPFNCGSTVELEIEIDRQLVGRVQYQHLDRVGVQPGPEPIANGTVGVLRLWTPPSECWDVRTQDGVHTHFEARNQSTASCYIDPPRGRNDQIADAWGIEDSLANDRENRR